MSLDRSFKRKFSLCAVNTLARAVFQKFCENVFFLEKTKTKKKTTIQEIFWKEFARKLLENVFR